MGKNVAVFVDVANIFYAAKAAGVDIDYVTLLKSATAGRDFVRAYAYTGLDPENENQRNFHQFLARHQYKVVSKDIRKYGDGKVKANLDIELVVDLMKTARNLDIAVIVSGDGDFASAIRAVQEMGVRCEVISFRGNTSSDLIEVADLFTDITQIAKVDKGSSRSGRRVADDDEDLSMTEVPEKQSEGTGRGRGRGRDRYGDRDRGRGRDREESATSTRTTSSRSVSTRSTSTRSRAAAAPVGELIDGGSGRLVALPGEKLSRAAAIAAAAAAGEIETFVDDTDELEELEPGAEIRAVDAEGEGEGDGRRRRRRRGGRGRGRGRRDETGAEGGETVAADGEAVTADDVEQDQPDADGELAPEVDEVVAPAPRAPRGGRTPRAAATPAPRTASGELPTPFDDMDALQAAGPRGRSSTPFGSVWDRQIGTPTRPAAGLAPIEDEEDLDEPEIPEYLLAERRQGQGNRGGQGGRGGQGNRGGQGGRGGGARSAYAAAIERERYGGARGTTPSRFAEPARGGSGSGGGRGDAGRGGAAQGGRPPRFDRPERVDRAPRSGGEEWSEVPPELEQQLLAQLARSKPAAASRPAAKPAPAVTPTVETASGADEAPKPRGGRRPAAKSVAEAAPAAAAPVAAAAETVSETPKRRTSTRKAVEPAAEAAPAAPVAVAPEAPEAKPAPKARAPRKTAAAGAAAEAAPAVAVAPAAPAEAKPAPKARAARKPSAAEAAPAAPAAEAAPADVPKRRTTRKAAAPEG